MLEERNFANERPARRIFPATLGLIFANVIVFLIQIYVVGFHGRRGSFLIDDYFALSLEGLRHGYIWQFLTFQFLHGGIWHILLNSWAIFLFGRVVEATLGIRRMLEVYFLSGIVGGMVQMLGSWLVPAVFGTAGIIGASAGAFGLVAVFAVLYPNEQLYVLLIIIPLKIRAMTLLWLSVALSVVGIVLPFVAPKTAAYPMLEDLFGNVAHAAHLGGILTGFLFARQMIRIHRRPPPVIPPDMKSSLNINPASD